MNKAWEELIATDKQEVWTTFRSEWWIDNGVKIERFNNGTIEIKNVMRNGDHYTNISEMQRDYFKDYGWYCGMYKVCVDEYERKLDSAEHLWNTAESDDERDKKDEDITEIRKKLETYKNKLDESLAGKDMNM